MREVKTFFLEGDHLNKGYALQTESVNDERSMMRRKIAHNLPSADLMAAYEELHPGTFEKLMYALEREQLHRQSAELASIQMHAKASAMGRLFGFFVISAICYTTFQLAVNNMQLQSMIFAIIAFGAVFGVSLMVHFKSAGRYDKRRNDYSPNQRHNLSPKPSVDEQKDNNNNGQINNNKGPRHNSSRRRRR